MEFSVLKQHSGNQKQETFSSHLGQSHDKQSTKGEFDDESKSVDGEKKRNKHEEQRCQQKVLHE